MWNAIKGAIFVDEGEAPKAEAPAAAGPTITSSSIPAVPSTIGSTVNPEFIAAIKKAVFSKQTALTSLVEAADKLSNIIPDPTTRFKAAYATAGNGRTVQQIAAAADIHLADVEGEELRFKAAVDAKLGTEIQHLEATASSAATQITNLQQQLEDTQRRIIQLTQQQAEASALASQKKTELQLTSDQFKAAAQLVRNEIQTLRQTVVTSLS
jgi:chromosome segregation ATPase